jgi:inositol phosphorylceramide mannosyltransferase catalytic subunit
MSLSVCCLTDAPGARIRAIMEPLREVADEIVLAADARVGEADLADYRAVADRVLRREVEFFEPHLAWLHEQCSGDWILRLDGDEVPSAALIERLPGLTVATDVRQYWLPYRWLDPTGAGWLDELPWSPDYHNRLVRNDETLSFAGRSHTEADPAFPSRYLEDPIYHLICPLRSREERLAHSFLSYELREPSRVAPGGGPFNATYYLPERFARRAPAPLPPADQELVSAALGSGSAPDARPRREHRPREASGSFRLLERDLRMYAGEVRGLFVEVANRNGRSWPGGLDEEPRVRISYHWADRHGRVLVFDGERSPLPAPLGDGETAIAPVTVIAPAEPGRYRLELDLVHEGVQWFGEEMTVELEVVSPAESERNVPGRHQRLVRRQRIPRVLHRVWLGPGDMPREHVRFGGTWLEHHPGWAERLWTEADLGSLPIPREAIGRATDPSELSNLVRYHVLALHGGVYVDTDFESLRSLEPLLGGVDAFAAYELPGHVATGIIGSTPGHPALRRAAELSLLATEKPSKVRRAGPLLLTHVLWDFPGVTLFPPELFYPYGWNELHRRDERFDGAYAVHHCTLSWAPASSP